MAACAGRTYRLIPHARAHAPASPSTPARGWPPAVVRAMRRERKSENGIGAACRPRAASVRNSRSRPGRSALGAYPWVEPRAADRSVCRSAGQSCRPDIVGDPMDKRLGFACVRVLHENREGSSPVRSAGPAQRGRDVLSVSGVGPRDRTSGLYLCRNHPEPDVGCGLGAGRGQRRLPFGLGLGRELGGVGR